jgi:outer membrane immunogenic protein
MTVRISIAFASLALLSVGSIGLAADLPARMPIATPSPFAPQAASSWEGFYAGVHAGYGQTSDDKVGIHHVGPGGGNVRNVGGNLKPGGGLGGLQAGYNWQSGAVVFGLEADASYLAGKSSFTGAYPAPIGGVITTSASKGFAGSLRSRLGYSFGNVLVYGTGGVSVTQIKYDLSPVGGVPLSTNNARIAPIFGAGVEYAFNNNWSARAEGLYTAISLRKLPYTPGAAGQVSTLETQSHWQARIGINYKFGGGPSQPVIARF